MGKIIMRTDMEVFLFFKEVEKLSEFIDFLRSRYRPSLKGEQYMTDTELAEKLKLNKRTLLEYRNTGKIPYYQIGGKILTGKVTLKAYFLRIVERHLNDVQSMLNSILN